MTDVFCFMNILSFCQKIMELFYNGGKEAILSTVICSLTTGFNAATPLISRQLYSQLVLQHYKYIGRITKFVGRTICDLFRMC